MRYKDDIRSDLRKHQIELKRRRTVNGNDPRFNSGPVKVFTKKEIAEYQARLGR
jgi:hypothetical protein